jgi:hypothetical protein
MSTSTVNGLTVMHETRRYGRQFYNWASVLNGDQIVSCGDPWPGATWPRKALAEAVQWAIAGLVLVDPAICSECGQFRFHSQACSQWRNTL